jgi:hypothetical protein
MDGMAKGAGTKIISNNQAHQITRSPFLTLTSSRDDLFLKRDYFSGSRRESPEVTRT